MAKHRLINCEFINSGSFKVNLSNKAKLLYLLMFCNGDDRGFVDNTCDIINSLEKNDDEFTNEVDLELLENTYKSALAMLVDKGLIYEFNDNHGNTIHLIRHWWYHNKLVKGLWTNYFNLLERVEIKNNEYVLKTHIKENKIEENNINQNKVNEVEDDDPKPTEQKPLTIQQILTIKEMFGKDKISSLTEEEKQKWNEYIDSLDTDTTLPF